MKSHLVRAGAALGTAALAFSTLFVTAGPAHAAGGNLTVSVVDQYGRPVAGVVQAFSAPGGTGVLEDGAGGGPSPFLFGTTHTFTGIPATGYAFQSITPWSGLDCAGASPCGFATPPSSYSPVVTVTDGGSATTPSTSRCPPSAARRRWAHR